MTDSLRETLRALKIDKPQAWMSGRDVSEGTGETLVVSSPIDGSELASLTQASADQVDELVARATDAFKVWRTTPAPIRGELVRRYGEILRERKADLAALVTAECGKIYQEALGEVQEMIDICDFAVGLSRQLYGLTIASERKEHRLAEQWHPLGPIGVISAFNFPVAVWAWNAALALVCGDPVIWKPSEKTPLTALACHSLLCQACEQVEGVPGEISGVVIGDADVGQALARDRRLPLVSATGSVEMGRAVAQTVAARLGRSLLELGGNNAAIVTPSADMELATRAIVFAAVGTCGQRCTTLRRLIVHQKLKDELVTRLKSAYERLPIGDPSDPKTLVGPLIDRDALEKMQASLEQARAAGGVVTGGEVLSEDVPNGGCYVRPAIVEIEADAEVLQIETFAPILYVVSYEDLEHAIEMQNGVPQGLSAAIFTSDMRTAEKFCSPAGADCGIVNVNIGTSGAEIGGAFGGEKDTGGGRESGSDAWKSYMRRSTNTINYSTELPLAQGIKFDFD